VAGPAVRGLFGALARLRGDRALHPDGAVVRGRFRGLGLAATREHEVLARFSRGAGLPEPLPDVLGCALRVVDAYGDGRHQDFVLASSGRRPVARHALLPGRSAFGAFYSSVLPYRLGGARVLFGAEMEPDGPVSDASPLATRAIALRDGITVRLLAASPAGAWSPVAEARFDGAVPAPEADRLRFNPWNCGPGIRPEGRLMALRDPAYRGSQETGAGRTA
jgi:hypothetical protein